LRDFRELKVWQKGHELAVDIYRITSSFPREEMYGLTSQIRRSSVSIPANIAEGCGRDSEAEFSRFLTIAAGSASELEYYIVLSNELKLLKLDDHTRLYQKVIEIKKMLTTLTKKLRVVGRVVNADS